MDRVLGIIAAHHRALATLGGANGLSHRGRVLDRRCRPLGALERPVRARPEVHEAGSGHPISVSTPLEN